MLDLAFFRAVVLAVVAFVGVFSGPAPSAAATRQLRFLIADFEASNGDKVSWLDGAAGARMMETHLTKAFEVETRVQLKIVERKKLNSILEEAGLPKSLSAIFEQKEVKERLEALGAEYLVFSSYLRVKEQVRIDAKIVKLRDVAADVSAYYVADAFDVDFQELANDLAQSLLGRIGLARPADIYNVVLHSHVKGDAVKGWGLSDRAKTYVPRTFESLLTATFKKMRLEPRDHGSNVETGVKALKAAYPSVRYFVIVETVVSRLRDDNVELLITLQLIERDYGVRAVHTRICHGDALFQPEVLADVFNKLAWPWGR